MSGAVYSQGGSVLYTSIVVGSVVAFCLWAVYAACRAAGRPRPKPPEPDGAARLVAYQAHTRSRFERQMGDARVDLALWEDEMGAER